MATPVILILLGSHHTRWTVVCPLSSTINESILSICRNHSGNVENWQKGNIAMRRCVARLVEAGKQFRRVTGDMPMPSCEHPSSGRSLAERRFPLRLMAHT